MRIVRKRGKGEACPEESGHVGRASDFALERGFRCRNFRPSVPSWNFENAGRANGFAVVLGFGRNEIFTVFEP